MVAWLMLAGTAGAWTNRYDPHFEKYSKRYFGADFDWRWWKAQAIAESALDSMAKSWCGAQGVMQVMPGTWKDIAPKLGLTNPWEVRQSIQAGIYYDARMWAIWKAPRPMEERIAFTLASYNAGAGNIIKAQRLVVLGQSSNEWLPVAARLHLVTGKHADETRGYVARIQRLVKTLSRHPP
ncbi:MAG: transglycosylase SLT domain-containing protein [bacterium]|nr:transglycosylase SLT domain-containing protein [bacterium]